jgi:hypothetical protein
MAPDGSTRSRPWPGGPAKYQNHLTNGTSAGSVGRMATYIDATVTRGSDSGPAAQPRPTVESQRPEGGGG